MENPMSYSYIIVLYHPTDYQITYLVRLAEKSFCIIVDNTPDIVQEVFINPARRSRENIVYIPLKKNAGIAEAQNIGIQEAVKRQIHYILFLDQDSTVDPLFAENMIAEYRRISAEGIKLAALGPLLINKSTKTPYKSIVHVEAMPKYKIVPALISSGTLVPVYILQEIGGMKSELFIDDVDFEWCWRAATKGYKCAITTTLQLSHKVGESDRSICGFPVILTTPVRYYYQYRNFLILCRVRYVPTPWKIKMAIRRCFCLFYIPLVSDTKWKVFRSMIKGVSDGIIYRKENFYER